MSKLYNNRTPSFFGDGEGGCFFEAHIAAMSEEGLHKDSEIAAELAHRDWTIAELEQRIDGLLEENLNYEGEVLDLKEQLSAKPVVSDRIIAAARRCTSYLKFMDDHVHYCEVDADILRELKAALQTTEETP